jgi:hypothetical protein
MKSNQLEPGIIILFHDKKDKRRPDCTGYNQIGIVIDNKKVLVQRNNKLICLDFNNIKGIKYCICKPKETKVQQGLIDYIKLNKMNCPLFQLALYSFKIGDIRIFEKPILMPKLDIIDNAEHCHRWNILEKNIKNGDLIFTFQHNNWISNFIAELDDGLWSHVGTYLNGKIYEATSDGVVKRDLTVYKKINFRVGVYSHWEKLSNEEIEIIASFLEKQIGKRYNYIGAIKLGLQKILGIQSKEGTPNDLIYGGKLFLVCIV